MGSKKFPSNNNFSGANQEFDRKPSKIPFSNFSTAMSYYSSPVLDIHPAGQIKKSFNIPYNNKLSEKLLEPSDDKYIVNLANRLGYNSDGVFSREDLTFQNHYQKASYPKLRSSSPSSSLKNSTLLGYKSQGISCGSRLNDYHPTNFLIPDQLHVNTRIDPNSDFENNSLFQQEQTTKSYNIPQKKEHLAIKTKQEAHSEALFINFLLSFNEDQSRFSTQHPIPDNQIPNGICSSAKIRDASNSSNAMESNTVDHYKGGGLKVTSSPNTNQMIAKDLGSNGHIDVSEKQQIRHLNSSASTMVFSRSLKNSTFDSKGVERQKIDISINRKPQTSKNKGLPKTILELKEPALQRKKSQDKQENISPVIKRKIPKESFPHIWSIDELNDVFPCLLRNDTTSSKKAKPSNSQSILLPSSTGCSRTDGYLVHLKHKIFLDEKKNNKENISNRFTLVTEPSVSEVLENSDMSKKFLFVSRSKIHLWGLFTSYSIQADTMIIYYKGELISNRVAFLREESYTKKGIGSSYLFRLDDDHVIDATRKGNIARFMNHSCDPNSYAKIINGNSENVSNKKKMKIGIFAKRTIRSWEEITYDYNFPIEEFDKVVCICKAAGCREVGAKCVCDACHIDISNTLHINCAECSGTDLCVDCFASGIIPLPPIAEKMSPTSSDRVLPISPDAISPGSHIYHHLPSHAYFVKEPLDFVVFDDSWRADEEIYLLEALQKMGMGNWVDVSFFLGSKTAEECRSHYFNVYLKNEETLLPSTADVLPGITKLPLAKIEPNIQENMPPAPSSSPSDHEVTGYMPKRDEFETEYENDAEHLVKDLLFLDTDNEFERELKFAILYTYCNALEKREERKAVIFEHNLVEYKKLTTADKERSKEERDIYHSLLPFARFMNREDFSVFSQGFIDEYYLKKYIHLLQSLRKRGCKSIEGAMSMDISKPFAQDQKDKPASISIKIAQKMDSNITKANSAPQARRGMGVPLDITDADGIELLSTNEKNLCSILRILPRLYLTIKETLIAANAKYGYLKRAQARGLIKIDVNKTSRIYDFFVSAGWIKPRLDKSLPGSPIEQVEEEASTSDYSTLDFSEVSDAIISPKNTESNYEVSNGTTMNHPKKLSSKRPADEISDSKKVPIVKLKLSIPSSLE